MKQLIIKKGLIFNEEVSIPLVENGYVLIHVAYSSISSGTELAGISQSQKTLIKRAVEKPEKIRMFINMLKRKGIVSTVKQIKDLNAEGKSSGYSISGIVEESGVDEFKTGDRVAAAGGGYAIHAEYVLVPKNLVVHVPDRVTLKEASAAAIGAIALHGVHRSDIKIGEYVAVIGCGLLGLFSIQILKAAGVRVISTDINEKKLQKARELGADFTLSAGDADFVQQVLSRTDGTGVDAVFFTAATSESQTLSKSFNICRKKGRVILVGVSGMNLKREDIYSKEIDFLISTSYGPGRYDKNYEEFGKDYPIAYVRWTENRNMFEFLRLIEEKKVNIESMIEAIHSFDQSSDAFTSLQAGKEKPLLVLLEYNQEELAADKQEPLHKIATIPNRGGKNNLIQVGIIGAGSFARDVHIPNLTKLKKQFKVRAIHSLNGYQAKMVARQNNAEYSTTDYKEILNDPDINLVMITTRHDSHGSLVLEALKAGKHVFVEKPLAITHDEVKLIGQFYQTQEADHRPLMMVGFNRRFSRYAREIKKHTDKRINPLFIRYRMNAGYLPADHWVFSAGGRIIGEACHIIDLMNFFIDSEIISINVTSVHPKTSYYSPNDNKSFILNYQDGSIAAIDYFSTGNTHLSKEYMEIHFDGKSIVLNDYRSLEGYGLKIKNIKTSFSDKGHLSELEFLYNKLSGKTDDWPIRLVDIFQTSKAAILIDNYK
jgi:predicted dehydrogenase/threonine dehydrogenase-like Zn-dependent dehydrogenase